MRERGWVIRSGHGFRGWPRMQKRSGHVPLLTQRATSTGVSINRTRRFGRAASRHEPFLPLRPLRPLCEAKQRRGIQSHHGFHGWARMRNTPVVFGGRASALPTIRSDVLEPDPATSSTHVCANEHGSEAVQSWCSRGDRLPFASLKRRSSYEKPSIRRLDSCVGCQCRVR